MLSYLNPFAWLRWLARFVAAWLLTIPWREVPKALPALILILVLVVTGFVAYTDSGSWRNRLLERQLRAAWEVDDFETAELVLRRQLENQPENAELRYRLAIARDAQDASDEALAMMRRLAAENEHAAAARWILRSEYDGTRSDELTSDQLRELGRLLSLIHRESPGDLAIKQLYANYLISAERLSEAVDVLSELAVAQPMRRLQAAAISRRLGNDTTAERLAEQTLAAVRSLAEEDPTNADLSLAIAQCQLFLKSYPDVLRTLDRAIRRAESEEDRKTLNSAVGDAIVAWVTSMEQETAAGGGGSSPKPSAASPARQEQILKMLQIALRYAPDHPRVLMLVANQVLTTPEGGSEKIAARRRALIEGSSPAISHFIQGTAALLQDDVESGTVHLEIAAELMPHSSTILNNLAVALSQRDGSDLEKALALSEKAIEQTSHPSPHFYDTRGKILSRLGRYTEAIADLERALAAEELRSAAHRTLAKCYAELGQEELSREHERAGSAGGSPESGVR